MSLTSRPPEEWIGKIVELKWANRNKPLLLRVFDVEVAPSMRYSNDETLWYWAKNA